MALSQIDLPASTGVVPELPVGAYRAYLPIMKRLKDARSELKDISAAVTNRPGLIGALYRVVHSQDTGLGFE